MPPLSCDAHSYCCKCAPNFALADNWLQDGSSTFNGESKVGNFNVSSGG